MNRDHPRRGRSRRAGPAGRPGSDQRGMTMLVVLMLMIVMLLGAGALGRMTEARSQITGNLAFREAGLAAAEVGTNSAFAALRALPGSENNDFGNWYFAQARPALADGSGIPDVVWNSAPAVTVDSYTVRYVVERLCRTTPVADPLSDCLVRQEPNLLTGMGEKLDPPNVRQFRATVQVTGPKNTLVFVQSMLNR